MILNNSVKSVYMNVDGNVQDLFDKTVAAKALRDGALTNLSIQRPKVAQLTDLYNDHKQKADACQSARNEANTGAGKNNKCHINTLTEHTNGAKRMLDQLNPAKTLLSKYEADLAKYETQLQSATNAYNAAAGTNISTAPSDPNLANMLDNYVDSNGNVKSGFTKYLKIGGGILVVGTVIFVVVKVLKK
jgi:hypothetical protein